MKKFYIAIAAAAVMAIPASANAKPCHDAKGHFIQCPNAPAVPPSHAAMAPRPAATHAATTPPVARVPARRCRNAKGQFARCGSPGTKPA